MISRSIVLELVDLQIGRKHVVGGYPSWGYMASGKGTSRVPARRRWFYLRVGNLVLDAAWGRPDIRPEP